MEVDQYPIGRMMQADIDEIFKIQNERLIRTNIDHIRYCITNQGQDIDLIMRSDAIKYLDYIEADLRKARQEIKRRHDCLNFVFSC